MDLFKKLPAEVKEGWEVEKDKAVEGMKDTAKRMNIRLSMTRLHDPLLQSVARKLSAVNSADDLQKLIRDIDLPQVSNDQFVDLLVAFGPFGLTALIGDLLESAKDEQDMQQLHIYSMIRNVLTVSHSLALKSHG